MAVVYRPLQLKSQMIGHGLVLECQWRQETPTVDRKPNSER